MKESHSEHQREASRQNGRRSRGPRTETGKRAVRLNGLRHGLRAMDLLLPNESMDEFQQVRSAFWSTYKPLGAIEEAWADRAVVALWRLRRLEFVEAGLLAYRISGIRQAQLKVPLLDFISDSYVPAEVSDEHAMVIAEQTTDRAILARAFAAEAPTFMILARYETSLVRVLGLAVSQLDARRAARSLPGQSDAVEQPDPPD
jgi:hypothetical protein